MSDDIVQFIDVRKEYIKGRMKVLVLDALTLAVPRGEFVAIMGPSGSGKSTILNLLAGFDKATAGQVLVDGTDIGKLSNFQLERWRLNTIGFVFQQYNLIQALKASENVEVPLRNLGVDRARRRQNVARVLDLVGLTERAAHFPNELSGGEEQRVAIARALVSDPKILVADEPTGSLDAAAAKRVLEILKLLNEQLGKTVIVVTHDPSVAAQAGRVLSLQKGVLSHDDVRRAIIPGVVGETAI